jgi:hypothetical protein
MAPRKKSTPTKQRKAATRKGPKKGKTALIERQRRQLMVFTMFYVDGKTYDEITVETGHSSATIAADLKAETARRAEAIAEDRDVQIGIQLAMVEDLRRKSLDARLFPGTGAFGAAAKSIELRAKLLGLDAPSKVDVTLQNLVDSLKESDDPDAPLS